MPKEQKKVEAGADFAKAGEVVTSPPRNQQQQQRSPLTRAEQDERDNQAKRPHGGDLGLWVQ